jgi:hypothetical protein
VVSTSESAEQAWRRLLRGGFAFESAPFAVHPLDQERARRMYYFALRAGASPKDILAEAKQYLENEVGLKDVADDNEQLKRVEQFLRQFKLVTKKHAAWLVFWNSMPAPDQVTDSPIVAILDARKSIERIADFVEQTYMASCYSLGEKIHYASRRKDNPYRANVNFNKEQQKFIGITCGHNPWLEARMVRNLRLAIDPESRQLLTWNR